MFNFKNLFYLIIKNFMYLQIGDFVQFIWQSRSVVKKYKREAQTCFVLCIIASFPLNSFAQCQRHVAPQARAVEKTVEDEVAAYPEVTYEELTSLIKEKKVFLVDANKKETYKSGHIPGAISYKKVEKKLEKKLPKEKNSLVVAYCGSPTCVAWLKPAKAATALGYTNVKHFAPGISGWKEAGGSTEK